MPRLQDICGTAPLRTEMGGGLFDRQRPSCLAVRLWVVGISLACLILGTPWNLHAREGATSLEDLKRCVATFRAEAKNRSDPTEGCLNLGFADCMWPLEGMGYTYKRYECFLTQFELWQAYLDETYALLLRKTEAGDPQRVKDGMPPATSALSEAHTAWLGFCERDCLYAGLRYGRGTLRINAPMRCYRDLTARRTLTYLSWIDTMEV